MMTKEEKISMLDALPPIVPPTPEEVAACFAGLARAAAPNCLSTWFPRLVEIGVKVPRTEIVRLPSDLLLWTFGEKVENFAQCMDMIRAACDKIGYPCFLRTGQTSVKHDWEKTCLITADCDLPRHVYTIAEYGAIADDLPADVWAARELLPTKPAFTAFHGHMPITREFRFFIKDGVIEHWQPYWPPGAIEGMRPSVENWRELLAEMNCITPEEYATLSAESERIGRRIGGFWSIDWLQTANGDWYCTDMALGAQSYRWDMATGEEV
jgi:hypothetical protein